jgi:thiol-disulfide isomerase/thioredoxin
MRYLTTLALAAALLVGWQTTGWCAYGMGDRPSAITGREIWSDKVISTEDFEGKWLFIDFFAVWCGPCMGELPNLVKETKDLRGDKFEVLAVSLDSPETADKLKSTLKKAGATWPCIYQGGTWKTPPAVEWGVRGIPATYLLNPQGVIVATNLRGETLRPALDFFLNHKGDYAPVSVIANVGEREFGAPLKVHFALANPRQTPLNLRVNVEQYIPVYAADDPEHKGRPVDMKVVTVQDGPDYTQAVDCSKFGYGGYDLIVDIDPNATYISIDYDAQLPETVTASNPDGLWLGSYYSSGLKKKEEPKAEPAKAEPAKAEG